MAMRDLGDAFGIGIGFGFGKTKRLDTGPGVLRRGRSCGPGYFVGGPFNKALKTILNVP